VLSQQVLTSPVSLLRFAQAATSSLTASTGFRDLTDLTGFGLSLRNLQAERIVFAAMPTAQARSDKNRVEATPEAAELWARIAADQPVGGPPATDVTPTEAPTEAPPAVETPWSPSGGVLTSADDSSTC
jgi:hypothetical protein